MQRNRPLPAPCLVCRNGSYRSTVVPMPVGKTIKLYLIDGTATGPIAAEIMNWTGQAVLIPRPSLHEVAGRDQVRGTGVYVLVGPDESGDAERAYVGEADSVYARLRQHDREKDFWTRAVAITSKDRNLTKAHGRYLEGRLVRLAHESARVALENATSPDDNALPESDRADMEHFLEQVRLVLPVLGLDFLRPVATRAGGSDAGAPPEFYLQEVGVEAAAIESQGRFVVLAGSTARQQATPSFRTYAGLRDRLIKTGKLVAHEGGLLRFADDVEFASPSAAASVVVAASRNGRISWRTGQGQSYADFKESQLRHAEDASVAGG